MKRYIVRIPKKIKKKIEKFPKHYQIKIKEKLKMLEIIPYPYGCVSMAGYENRTRIRVGIYRIVYEVFEYEIVVNVVNIDNRKDVYKGE